MAQAPMRRAIESGVPDNQQFLHPLLKKNYGNWRYHDRPRPGVLHHVARGGDEVWSVRAGTQRQMDVHTVRKLCDIADQYAEGHVRFTIRSNIEFMVSRSDMVAPLIERLETEGFPVGGTGNSISMIAHTQGWLHCDIPGTDASGAVKALMDELYEEFKREEMPNRVHMSTSCCEINCGGQADIAIIVQHTKPPKINHDLVANVCERPAVVARCPVAAIRPAVVNGKPSLEVGDLLKPEYQAFVKDIEKGVTKFEPSTGTFMTDMVRFGPSKYDIAAVYEGVAISQIENAQGRWGNMKVYYPSTTIWSDHPAALLQGDWVTEAQKAAARTWIAYLESRPIQEKALALGFRPASPDVPIQSSDPNNPFVRYASYGVQAEIPPVATPPDGTVVRNLLTMWSRVVKP